ncbi:uncharacterized protein LOC127522267 [Ctenopharyngodon idella]|uniref:uncharacterized protein LOC127522267 n=1 Tax=Ctenopharyngodon idella TaxID=7959 RepID=UPI002231D9F2|nr:uncharacterized protein LOC127522267 [Ctenopharyngodon idella]XP_051767998.1 uncharacterized protein LOC127522267 [Ctenopharyngodon idella]
MRQPEPEEKRTELTLAPEVELHHESDQGCEPTTSADEGVVTTENEDWLINFTEEASSPTLSHPLPSSSLFSNCTNDCTDCVMSCYYQQCQYKRILRLRLPPLTSSLHLGLSTPSWLLPHLPPPETLGLAAPPGFLILPAPPWSVVTPLPPRTCGPSAAICPSTPTAAAGSFSASSTHRLHLSPQVILSCQHLDSSISRLRRGLSALGSSGSVVTDHLHRHRQRIAVPPSPSLYFIVLSLPSLHHTLSPALRHILVLLLNLRHLSICHHSSTARGRALPGGALCHVQFSLVAVFMDFQFVYLYHVCLFVFVPTTDQSPWTLSTAVCL